MPSHLAPEGVYFLVVKKSVETPEGLIGLRPATRLHRQADGSFKTVEGIAVEVGPHDVTNDLRVAQRVFATDAASSAVLRKQMQKWADQAAAATPKPRPSTPVPPPVVAPVRRNPLDKGSYNSANERSSRSD